MVFLISGPPSFRPTVQTFEIGATAYIECDADPGDPPQKMFWVHNGFKFRRSETLRFRTLDNFLIIDGITYDDAGIYRCGFNTPLGLLSTDILVNVVPILPSDASPTNPGNVTTSKVPSKNSTTNTPLPDEVNEIPTNSTTNTTTPDAGPSITNNSNLMMILIVLLLLPIPVILITVVGVRRRNKRRRKESHEYADLGPVYQDINNCSSATQYRMATAEGPANLNCKSEPDLSVMDPDYSSISDALP